MAGEPRTVIVSDTHLGRSGPVTAVSLRPLWEGFDRVVINGDVAEVQIPRLRAAAAREVQALQRFADHDGVELVLISGNHDAYLSDTRHLTMLDDQVLVTHGDVLHPAVAPWTHSAAHMKVATTTAMAESSPQDHHCIDYRLALSQHVSHTEFLHERMQRHDGGVGLLEMALCPWRVVALLHYWWKVPDLAALFAQQCCPQAQVVVFGHSHRQGIWQRRGKVILNTGSFSFPGRPRAVVVEGSRVEVRDIVRRQDGYRIGPQVRMQMHLPESQAA